MHIWVLRAVCILILRVCPLLWKIRGDWAFDLHQRLGRWVIESHHKYNLDVL
jgi:hypothetical protein